MTKVQIRYFVMFALLVGSRLPSTAQAQQPLSAIFQNLPTADDGDDIWSQAAGAQSTAGPKYTSTAVEMKTFEGTFVPATNNAELWVFSDDGVNVQVKLDEIPGPGDTKQLSKKGNPQHLPTQGESLHKVPFTFQANKLYGVRVEYQNIVDNGESDIDGCTLFSINGNAGELEVDLDAYDVADADEEDPGACVVVNLDDDNDNQTPDKDENPVSGEDDLLPLAIDYTTGLSSGTLQLDVIAGASKVKIWDSANKATQLTLPKTWDLSSETPPTTVYLEGVARSDAPRDVTVELKILESGSEGTDIVKVTIVGVDLDAAGVADADEEDPGACVTVNHDDDNDNQTADKDENPVTGEDDLLPLTLDHTTGVTSGTLRLDVTAGGSKVKIWDSATKGTQLTLPKTWDLSSETPPTTVYLEGVVASDSERDVTVELKIDEQVCGDIIKVTVVEVDLDAAGVADADEEDPGACVAVNLDDDNGNQTADKDENPVTGEDDLLPLTIDYTPNLTSGTLTLDAIAGASKVKIWDSATKTTQLTLPKTWDLSSETPPTTVYLEGVATSDASRDVTVELKIEACGSELIDTVKVTVVEVDLDAAGVADADEEDPGACLAVNGDDDNDNQTVDKDENPVTGEDDLLPLTIDYTPDLTSGTLTLDVIAGASKVKIWDSATKGTELTLPKTWDLSSETPPTTVYLEGVVASDSERDVTVELKIEACGNEVIDTVKVTVIEVDLDASGVADADEEDPGACLAVNSDDDNDNQTVDKDENPVTGEDDLLPLTIDYTPDLASGTLTLDVIAGASKVKIWDSATKTTQLTLPKTWDLSSETPPTTVYLEGVASSVSARDVTVELKVEVCGSEAIDTVKVTVEVDLDASGVADDDEEDPGAFVAVNLDDDNGNQTADKDEDPVTGEDDLLPLTIDQTTGLTSGTLSLDVIAGASKVKIWDSATKGTELTLPKTWDLSSETPPTTVYLEGVAPSDAPRDVTVELKIAEAECGDIVKVTVVQVDLDVNTNRDTIVDDVDDPGENQWVKDRGAIFMVNYDDDDDNGSSDAIEFDESGEPINEDTDIDDAADVADVAQLIVRATGSKTGLQFFLRMPAEDAKAVHVFEERAAGRSLLQTPAGADWSGWAAHGDAAGNVAVDITASVNESADVDLGIEGLFFRGQRHALPGGAGGYEFDGEVDVELVVQATTGATTIVPGSVIHTDSVRLKIAPYLMLSNTHNATEVWMSEDGRTDDIATAFGGLAQRVDDDNTQWFQDHVQIGMIGMPGSEMHLTIRMPYVYRDSLGVLRGQPGWPVTAIGMPAVAPLLRPGRGIYRYRNTFFDGADSGDIGGNLEIIPYSDEWPLGRIILGNTMSPRLSDFFEAQILEGPDAVQEPFQAGVEWLRVGHVDEVMCALPGGGRGYKVAMASPDYAHTLLTAGDPARGVAAAPAPENVVFGTGAEANGTASNTISTTQNLWLFDGAAHGHIHCIAPGVSGTGVADGETVTISDGVHVPATIFEFDTDGTVAGGNVQVDIATAVNAEDVRDALLAAVNGVGAGLTVSAHEDGTDDLVLTNDALGVAGNVPIAETVVAAGFTRQGMSGGEAAVNGRDFTTTAWRWVRIFDGTGAGQVALIDPADGAIRGVGFLSVRNTAGAPVFQTTTRVAWDSGVDRTGVYRFVSRDEDVPRTSGWAPEPDATSRYVVAQDCRNWRDDVGLFPALITVHELLGDATLWLLNGAAQGEIDDVMTTIKAAMGPADPAPPAGDKDYLRHDSDITDDSLAGDADDDFLSVPVIYFGEWSSGLKVRQNMAYTPGLANLQPGNAGLFVFPQQFFARVGGADIFETATSSIVGAAAQYADDWDLYHRLDGEVHCATAALRELFTTDWWENQP